MGTISNYLKDDRQVMYLDEGLEYTMDGDVVDKRNRMIRKLKSQLTVFRRREKRELKLREDNVAVQDAWDKYQTVLTLARKG